MQSKTPILLPWVSDMPMAYPVHARLRLRTDPWPGFPYVGRVTMDMVMLDVGRDNAPHIGDVATLIGTDGDAMISLDEFANWSGTVSYEVLTRLGARLPRVYIDE